MDPKHRPVFQARCALATADEIRELRSIRYRLGVAILDNDMAPGEVKVVRIMISCQALIHRADQQQGNTDDLRSELSIHSRKIITRFDHVIRNSKKDLMELAVQDVADAKRKRWEEIAQCETCGDVRPRDDWSCADCGDHEDCTHCVLHLKPDLYREQETQWLPVLMHSGKL